jgi:hypothetical protein
MVLRIFVLKRDKVTGEWRKLNNKEIHDLYYEERCRLGCYAMYLL